ncbi:hypothetical protein K435DRAFT_850936 [Dendrothele bispora CBS 962.96]|uniref:Tyr recombinase domain-containing protein n=1 Tax=Dendrothele bispora (strain CBS 962.96) TaxID=1314807 RepID=A0A4S8MNE1_DENBC|nr:hypothetical protein K435DRAFT_850936 [Dendrothele bispora CBS 962.96]
MELPPLPDRKYSALDVKLLQSKTSKDRTDHIHIAPFHGTLNATKFLHKHVTTNNLSPDDPLMAYRDNAGRLKVLTKSLFQKVCNEAWSKRGYPRFSGHSFRIGGTTYLLQCGVDCHELAGPPPRHHTRSHIA